MRLLTLSDHTSSQVREIEAGRVPGGDTRPRTPSGGATRTKPVPGLGAEDLRGAWRRGLWAGLAAGLRWIGALLRPRPNSGSPSGADDHREAQLRAGNEGELRVLQVLRSSLGSAWTVIKGYKGRAGEIDLIAVGPEGIAALEIKHVNGVIGCNGDLWWRDKYDRYGNLVEARVPLKGRRTPSIQVNQSADALERYLGRAGLAHRVVRAIVLSHDRSACGSLSRLTIDKVVRLRELNLPRICALGGYRLAAAEITKIVAAIEHDHRTGERISQQRGGRTTPAR